MAMSNRTTASIPTTQIQPGAEMPMLGFGVYQIPDPAQCEQA